MIAEGPYRRDAPGPSLGPGARVGPYVLQTRLRSDAMSEAHVALRGALTVRLTLARPRDDPDGALARLVEPLRVARMCGRRNGSDILPVYDSGVADGRVYVATDLPTGQPLLPWSREGPRKWRAVLAVVHRVGEALALHNDHGQPHLGLTPDDITIDRWGGVQVDYVRALLDGLAAIDPTGRFTAVGDPRETAWYEAPELWAGLPRSEHSDQYSLCAVAWRALYDQHAYTGETPHDRWQNVLANRVQAAPPGSSVPANVRYALGRGLSRRRRDRWPSLAALLDALGD